MSYADDLAKDRDRYRKQRDFLARHMNSILEEFEGNDPKKDAPVIRAARKALMEIYDNEPTAEQLLGLHR